ncbi:MAG: lytic transglycosylase domain-containing protein [Rickettsiales bacterium]|nr:lytic transglycosylase domain-containing protein [Rickettsiales bacterium]
MQKILYTLVIFFTIQFIGQSSANANINNIHKWPVNNYEVQKLGNSIRDFRRQNWRSSVLDRSPPADPVIKKILRWREYVGGSPSTTFKEITDFIKYDAYWPRQDELRKNAEYAITETTDPEEIIRWFAINTPTSKVKMRFKRPLTPKGMIALADALIKKYNVYNIDKAVILTLIKEAWYFYDFNPSEERKFLAKYGKVLVERDYQRKLDRFLTERKFGGASRMTRYIGADYKKLYQARMALINNSKNYQTLLSQVPRNLQNDQGLIFERIKWRQNRNMSDGVLELLKMLPSQVDYPEKWWDIRKKYVIDLIQKRRYVEAYYMAKDHSIKLDRTKIAEAEWYAGWLAFRYLKNRDAAVNHFRRIYDVSQAPISIARGAYWLGRTHEEKGNRLESLKWYREGAKYPVVYYGQLSVIKSGSRVATIPMASSITSEDLANYRNNELAKAAYILNMIGENGYGKEFIIAAAAAAQTSGERVLVAQMGLERGRYDYALRVAKEIYKIKKEVVINSLFPLFKLETVNGTPVKNPEEAAVLAIMRQESEFDVGALSPAGARGLMQIMPATAQMVARQLGLPYRKDRLISDPRYNITLGAAYLASRLKRFDGSFMLAFASYNAGEGNVQKWINRFGDPRKFNSLEQVIDWVELIPFSETQNYVQRTLENLQVYRIALSGDKTGEIFIDKDLLR